MSIAIIPTANANVVHEAEAQRQHARLKLPARISFNGPDGHHFDSELIDLSAGGFSFSQISPPIKNGSHCKGKLHFVIDGLSMAIDIEFQVRAVYADGHRVGCEFHNLRQREISALRYLITSYLSGEMVTIGDMLNTLQRDNFGKERKNAANSGMGFFARLRAFSFSLVFLGIGVIAFAYVVNQLYTMYFVTHADSAVISVPTEIINMPRDGSVVSLVKVGAIVAKGAPLATLSANMLDVLKGSLPDADISPDNLERLFSRNLQGTLTSPCDCRVSAQQFTNGALVAHGLPVFELVPVGSVASIDARFAYKSFNKVQPGAAVRFQVAGESLQRNGTIATSVLQQGPVMSDIEVGIVPEDPLPVNLIGRPVDVSIVGMPISTGGFFDKYLAADK